MARIIWLKRKKWVTVNELIQLLDPNLVYECHELTDNRLNIHVSSIRTQARCPYCGTPSPKVHSVYPKSFQDLPIQGKKVMIHLVNRKFFCLNPDCIYHTFSERFDCIADKAKKTKRLEEEILTIAIQCSSVTAAKILTKNTADIKKSSICRLLRKERLRSTSSWSHHLWDRWFCHKKAASLWHGSCWRPFACDYWFAWFKEYGRSQPLAERLSQYCHRFPWRFLFLQECHRRGASLCHPSQWSFPPDSKPDGLCKKLFAEPLIRQGTANRGLLALNRSRKSWRKQVWTENWPLTKRKWEPSR